MPLFNIFSRKADQEQNKHHIFIQSKRCCSRDHYQVLGVEKSATSKEIRKSFIELTKKLHPDINKDPKTHDRFVKINEAYSTLIKPLNRKDYDQTLAFRVRAKQQEASTVVSPHTYGSSYRPGTDFEGSDEGQFYWDETLWHYKEQSKDRYYEQEAQKRRALKKDQSVLWWFLKRLTTTRIVIGCIGLMSFGGVLHYYIFYAGKGGILETLNDRDKMLASFHTEAKEQAKLKGNKAQLERLHAIAAANKYTCQNDD